MTGGRIGKGDRRAVELGEPCASLRTVVERQQKSSLQASQEIGEALELRIGKVVLVQMGVHIRRVALEECGLPVVASEDLLVGRGLKLDAVEAFSNLCEVLRKPMR